MDLVLTRALRSSTKGHSVPPRRSFCILTPPSMFAFLAALALLTTAWAHPRRLHHVTPEPRDTPCTDLGGGSTDTASYRFTLAAHNFTLSNSNDIAVPLTLGWSASEGNEEASDWDMSVSLACYRTSVAQCPIYPYRADPGRMDL